jgi:hypothetical protein
MLAGNVFAFEHEESDVHFHVYNKNIVEENRKEQKPFFLLFAAEWCHWCHVFNEKTLTNEKVISFLNKNFVNIFIDSDIHTGAYQKYKANGVPYTVFLNPDASVYYQYSGTLYAEPFLEVIQGVYQNIKKGLTVDGDEILPFEYTPPTKFHEYTLDKLRSTYIKGVLDNFDTEEYGVGNGVKEILPETFLYLLNTSSGRDRQDVVLWISETLKKAIDKIYDPVEGGFFRYAEKDNWDIPHYEKIRLQQDHISCQLLFLVFQKSIELRPVCLFHWKCSVDRGKFPEGFLLLHCLLHILRYQNYPEHP